MDCVINVQYVINGKVRTMRDVQVLIDSIVNADPETSVEEIQVAAQAAKEIVDDLAKVL